VVFADEQVCAGKGKMLIWMRKKFKKGVDFAEEGRYNV
jgi:hypothetical protein